MKVKKLVSLNPDKYIFLPLDFAIARYGEYCYIIGKYQMLKDEIKSFKEWLKTEI